MIPATLHFKDGREIQSEAGGMWHVYMDKDGKRYTFERKSLDRYEEVSCEQMTRWSCDRGHDWWSSAPESEQGCSACRRLVHTIDLMMAESKRQSQSWWRNVVDVLVDAARKRVRQ